MPTYEYRFEDGDREIVEVFHSMSQDPLTEIDGRPVELLISGGSLADAKLKADSKYPYVSARLPRNLEGCPTDKSGKPVILNKRHEREICAAHGYKRE